jgi:uncharacterized membrane protein YgcG
VKRLPRRRPAAAVAALSVSILAGLAPSTSAAASAADPLGCDAPIYDPERVLDHDEIEPARAATARALAADVRVRVERAVDGDLDARIEQLREQCAGWSSGRELADDLVVVIYSAAEREAGIYYGEGEGPALNDRWEPAVDAMIEEFRAGDFSAGVSAGLVQLRHDPGTTTGTSSSSSSGGTGFAGGTVLLIVAMIGLAVYGMYRRHTLGERSDGWSSDDSSYSRRRNWSSGSRTRRSFSSSRRSSRSSRSRSSGGRRSGGGSKRW